MKRILLVDVLNNTTKKHIRNIEKHYRSKVYYLSKDKVIMTILDEALPKWLSFFVKNYTKELMHLFEIVFGDAMNEYIYGVIDNRIELHRGEINNTLFVITGMTLSKDVYYFKKCKYKAVSVMSEYTNFADFSVGEYDERITKAIISSLA